MLELLIVLVVVMLYVSIIEKRALTTKRETLIIIKDAIIKSKLYELLFAKDFSNLLLRTI